MYSSSYARAKSAPEARAPPHRPRGKSCGYYMRIVFFFSSLIQSLIIISLVLFLIYGQPEKSAEEKKVQDLEQNFNRLSEMNLQLKKEKAEAAAQLGARSAEKAALEAELAKLKVDAGKLEVMLRDKRACCERMTETVNMMARRPPAAPFQPPPVYTPSGEMKTLQTLTAQQKARIQLLEANFTQTVQYLSQERDGALRERDARHHDATALRKDNGALRGQLAAYTRKCKEDFAQSLEGIQTVTRDFLNKITNLFPHQLTFHLTCERQQEQMEKIRSSCTNLSRDVENKFQLYLDNVGHKVAEIQAKSSELEVQNSGLTSHLQQCERTHSEAVAQATRQQQLTQTAHDNQVEKLLVEQKLLREQKESLVQRERELQNLQQTFSAQPNAKPAGLQAPAAASGFRRTPTVR